MRNENENSSSMLEYVLLIAVIMLMMIFLGRSLMTTGVEKMNEIVTNSDYNGENKTLSNQDFNKND